MENINSKANRCIWRHKRCYKRSLSQRLYHAMTNRLSPHSWDDTKPLRLTKVQRQFLSHQVVTRNPQTYAGQVDCLSTDHTRAQRHYSLGLFTLTASHLWEYLDCVRLSLKPRNRQLTTLCMKHWRSMRSLISRSPNSVEVAAPKASNAKGNSPKIIPNHTTLCSISLS